MDIWLKSLSLLYSQMCSREEKMKILCPIPYCNGYATFSGNANLGNHIKNLAKSELLASYLLNKGRIDHAEWMKHHIITEAIHLQRFKIGEHMFTIKDNENKNT